MNQYLRIIAFYLPQFHPIPENDEWWGMGFTEWHNVVRGKARVKGQYQPHIPADLGFYDLRLDETREAQAKMAKEYGISGFCYYHYWFNGRNLLGRPLKEILASGKPDFPFCLCWANENWTRVWDGGERHILMEQKYSLEDDIAHLRSLIPSFRDRRYIKINDKPLFLVYRTELIPNPKKTAEIWREELFKAGLGEIFLARVEMSSESIDPKSIGFDAAVEFAPDWKNLGELKVQERVKSKLSKIGLISKAYAENWVGDYERMSKEMLKKKDREYLWIRCVTPSFDNSARRSKNAAIFLGATPEKYEIWLKEIIRWTTQRRAGDERIVFINAWNEWGEGNHLEPDLKWGRAFLEATRSALNSK